MGVRRLVAVPAALVGVALLATACARGEALRSEAIAASEEVTIEARDGTPLAGRVFGPADATAGIVFAHMAGSDQSAWYLDAQRMADAGYRTLTYDARGTCPGGDAGCSEGDADPSQMPSDLAAAVRYLRDQGVERIALVGASMGGTAALSLAATGPPGVDAVVTLSAPQTFSGLGVSPQTLSSLPTATLFIAGTGDTPYVDDAQTMQASAAQPSSIEIVTSDDHGTDLLTGNAGGRVRDAMDAWIGRYLAEEPAA